MSDIYDDEVIKDVHFTNVNESSENNIRGKVLYYSTKQVADTLGVTDATIRYYSNFFEDILKIKKTNTQRQYTDDDINKLEFIFKLRSDGMTMNQVKEYCSEVDFDGNKPVIKESNPLSIQALAQALMVNQEEQIEKMKIDILESIERKIETYFDSKKQTELDGFESLREDIGKSVNNIVSEKLDNVTSSINEIKENINTKFISREEIEAYSKKKNGFFSRFLNR